LKRPLSSPTHISAPTKFPKTATNSSPSISLSLSNAPLQSPNIPIQSPNIIQSHSKISGFNDFEATDFGFDSPNTSQSNRPVPSTTPSLSTSSSFSASSFTKPSNPLISSRPSPSTIKPNLSVPSSSSDITKKSPTFISKLFGDTSKFDLLSPKIKQFLLSLSRGKAELPSSPTPGIEILPGDSYRVLVEEMEAAPVQIDPTKKLIEVTQNYIEFKSLPTPIHGEFYQWKKIKKILKKTIVIKKV
jgi:hypothetical protein